MKWIFYSALLILHVGCLFVRGQDQEKVKLAITGAVLVPMDHNGVVNGKTLLLEGGKITGIKNAGDEIPAGYTIVAADGKFIIPGLCDMHIHLRDLDEMPSYLRYGVTTVLHMSGPLSTASDLAGYREDIREGRLTAPYLYFASRNVEGAQMNFPGVSVSLTSPKQVEDFVEDAFVKKVDFIKVYETIDSVLYFDLIREAEKKRITVIGHTPRNIDPVKVLRSGQKMIAHVEEFFFDFFKCRDCGNDKRPDETMIDSLVQILQETKMYVTPNLSFVFATKQALEDTGRVWADPEVKYLPPAVFQAWQSSNPNNRSNLAQFKARETVKYPFLQKLTRALYKAGIPLLAGTDASLMGLPPGKSLIQDLLELNKAGVDNYGCLQAATSTPGVFLSNFSVTGKQDLSGQIKAGYNADLLILDKNPLVDLNNLLTMHAVIVHGRYMTRNDIDIKRRIMR